MNIADLLHTLEFDDSGSNLKLFPFEREIITFDDVEDTKGNKGQIGNLVLTDRRFIWSDKSNTRINMFGGIFLIVEVKLYDKSKIRVMIKRDKTRFEFIFDFRCDKVINKFSDEEISERIKKAEAWFACARNFKNYYNLQLRKPIEPFPNEHTILEAACENLSSDARNDGIMLVTNYRVVWSASSDQKFNVSIPYYTIDKVTNRDSKFGPALVLNTSKHFGGYVLGFQFDAVNETAKLTDIVRQYSEAFQSNVVWQSKSDAKQKFRPIL